MISRFFEVIVMPALVADIRILEAIPKRKWPEQTKMGMAETNPGRRKVSCL
jgi:hypothetical protein